MTGALGSDRIGRLWRGEQAAGSLSRVWRPPPARVVFGGGDVAKDVCHLLLWYLSGAKLACVLDALSSVVCDPGPVDLAKKVVVLVDLAKKVVVLPRQEADQSGLG